MTTTCDECGGVLRVGDWPICHGDPARHAPAAFHAHGDDIPGGLWIENLGPEPVKVYSHSERKAIMKARGLREQVRWAGPTDRHLTRWV